MSQSPTSAINTNEALNYVDALGKLDRLVQSGKSLSGRERNCCFLNIGSPRFANISAVSGLDFIDDARAVATVDWDHDGDLDLWIANRTGPQLRFLRNDIETGHHYVSLRLEGRAANRDGIGARVEVFLRADESANGGEITEGPGPTDEQRSKEGARRNQTMEGTRQSSNPSGGQSAADIPPRRAYPASRIPHPASRIPHPASRIPHPASQNGLRLTKSLRAGDGFLSQSSKWIHFGLGQQEQIDRVVVHWPGGEREEFTGVQSDGRYRLVQGSGTPHPVALVRRNIELNASELAAPPSMGHAHLWLASRVPMPVIRYLDFTGTEVELDRAGSGPVLLNFWASWCQPCLTELGEFAQHEPELRDSGLNIVALSVDGLGGDRSAKSDPLRRLLMRLKYTWDAGLAQEQVVDKLELVYAELFSRQVSLPVPASFLIDADGLLAAVYLGRVSVERLLKDVQNLSVDDARRRELAVPFTGRWTTPPAGVDLGALAGEYTRAQYVEDSIPLYRRILAHDAGDVHAHNMLAVSLSVEGDLEGAERHFRQAIQLNPEFVKSHYNLGLLLAKQGRIGEAIESFRDVVQIAPDYAEAHLNLAVGLESERRHDEALVHYREAVRADPRELRARRRLAISLLRQGSADESLVHFRELLRLQPDNAAAHNELAVALTQQGTATEAVVHYRRALQLRPDWSSPMNNLAWILATSEDDELRDPSEAVRLAERASQNAADKLSPSLLDTLAAAYASAEQFDKAVRTTQRAIKLAEAAGKNELVDQLNDRLRRYKQGQPYRETPQR